MGTQCLHAVGCAEAGRHLRPRRPQIEDRDTRYRPDEVTYVSIGEGGTSEGEFWESLNTACTRKLPILYLVEDNGYAISVPVEVQTAGGDITRLVEGFPGLACSAATAPTSSRAIARMREAVAHARERKGPVLVHATVIRPYSHSHSDDERLYKTPGEREAEARRDPLRRMQQFLKTEGLATDQDLADIARRRRPRGERRPPTRRYGRPSPIPPPPADFVFSPDVDPTSADFATEPRTTASPTRWWRPSTPR